MTAVADGAECKVAIEFKGRVMDMREQGSCTSFRGLSCYFGVRLTRVQSGPLVPPFSLTFSSLRFYPPVALRRSRWPGSTH